LRWVFLTAVLFGFWAVLSFEITNPFLLGSGLLTAGVAAALSIHRKLVPEGDVAFHLRTLVTYLPWLLWQIFAANGRVIRVVWSPELPIDPRMVEVPCSLSTHLGRAIYANSITLTPGTVTVLVEENRLLVHALTAQDEADLLSGAMESRIKLLEAGT
jgi:multicomponent Na+:H+ antiporter subunit E